MSGRSQKGRRIFYFAPVAVSTGESELAASPAGTNKVLGICLALKSCGASPVIVSSLEGNRTWGKLARIGRWRSQVVASLYAPGRGATRRLVSAVSFLLFAMRAVRTGDRVIFYNYFGEYLLAAAWLRIRGRTAVIDIEDAPRLDEPGARGKLNRLSFEAMKKLCVPRYLIVSHSLARHLELETYLPVYGISTYFAQGRHDKKLCGPGLRVSYGGSLMPETGAELFIGAIRLLIHRAPQLPIHFFISGRFDTTRFSSLAEELNSTSGLRMELMSRMGGDEFRKLSDTMDVGLCLKLPSTEMGQTTFPSKVIEIAAMGMLLVTTKVSDVPLVFDDRTAVFLGSEDPAELANLLTLVATDFARYQSIAKAGQDRVQTRLSAERVGPAILRLLNG